MGSRHGCASPHRSAVPGMDSMGGVKVSAHYCGPPVPDPDARPRGAGGVGEYADAAAEKAAAARVAEVVASNARLVGATCPHLESVRALQPELPRLQPYMYTCMQPRLQPYVATLCILGAASQPQLPVHEHTRPRLPTRPDPRTLPAHRRRVRARSPHGWRQRSRLQDGTRARRLRRRPRTR